MIQFNRLNSYIALIAASAVAMAPVSVALARPANQMTDLVGARGSSGESQLMSRGFTHIVTSEGAYNTKHSYWWNGRDKNCLHVETYDGRYSAITDGIASDCHQSGGAGAAVAVVAGSIPRKTSAPIRDAVE